MTLALDMMFGIGGVVTAVLILAGLHAILDALTDSLYGPILGNAFFIICVLVFLYKSFEGLLG